MKTTMSFRYFAGATLLALLAVAPGRAAEDSQQMASKGVDSQAAKAQAQKVAQSWLELVDQGQYAKSWEEAAALLREEIPQGAWAKSVGGVRETVGKLKSRKLKSVKMATDMPGMPDGEYVVIEYETVFATRPAFETITPMLDEDGIWRVSGYNVKYDHGPAQPDAGAGGPS